MTTEQSQLVHELLNLKEQEPGRFTRFSVDETIYVALQAMMKEYDVLKAQASDGDDDNNTIRVLRDALFGLRRGRGCWCDSFNHTAACLLAKKALGG